MSLDLQIGALILLALVAANLPFINHRLMVLGPTRAPKSLAWRLLEEAHVAVTPGKDFGLHEPKRYLRFAYTAPVERLAEGLRRIRTFLGSGDNQAILKPSEFGMAQDHLPVAGDDVKAPLLVKAYQN